jgi:transposase-like protein
VSNQPQRAFSTGLKERIVQRIDVGERLAAVADEMGIRRKLLYEWRAAHRALGAAGLNRQRGPKPGFTGIHAYFSNLTRLAGVPSRSAPPSKQ